MPHISKRKLEEKEINDLFLQIIYTLERAVKRNELRQVLRQLLTSTEKIMLAKRLAVISMLSEGVPIHEIAKSLAMSPSTTSLMSARFESERYSHVIKSGLRKSDLLDIIKMIETVGGLMPSRKKGLRHLSDSFEKDFVEHRLRNGIQKSKSS